MASASRLIRTSRSRRAQGCATPVGHSSSYSEAGSAQNLIVGDRTFHNLEGRIEVAFSRFDEITAKGWLKTTVTLGGLAMQRLGGQTISTVLIGQNLSSPRPATTPLAASTPAGASTT